MQARDVATAMLLGMLATAIYLGVTVGDDLARYYAMTRALNKMDACVSDTECDAAWAEFQMARRK